MADSTPPVGDSSKPSDRRETVRITLPPRPMQTPPPTATAGVTAASTAVGKGPGTVPAIPVPQKKETSRLKKTTGKVPGATRPALPVVPPPTIRSQPVAQAPSTVAAAPPPTIRSQPVAQAPSTVAAAPPPTIRSQPVAQAPSTVAAAPPPPQPPATVSSAPPRPTARLQASDIPTRPPAPASQQMPVVGGEASKAVSAPPSAAVPVIPPAGGPTWLDAVLGLLVMAVSGVVAFLLWQVSNVQ